LSASKLLPDGAHTVGAVKIALKNVVDKRRDLQGAPGMLAKGAMRVSERISGALGEASASAGRSVRRSQPAMTLSSSVRVGIAGPVGAGETSLATTLEIALNRIVPCWSEGVQEMFKRYAVRVDGSKKVTDGSLMKPYEERAVLGDDDGRQLVLCDMPGIRDAVKVADEFAGHLADERRTKDRSLVADFGFALQKKADTSLDAARRPRTSSSWPLTEKS
jgi:hypothetical protein